MQDNFKQSVQRLQLKLDFEGCKLDSIGTITENDERVCLTCAAH